MPAILLWAAGGATVAGLFFGVREGTERMFTWVTVGGALYLLYQLARDARPRPRRRKR